MQIEVVEQTYQDLERLKRPGETVADVVARLIVLYNAVNQMMPVFKGQVAYADWWKKRG